MVTSEIAQVRESIASEYMAARWGLTGFAVGISRHDFITSKMEKMGAGQARLVHLVGEQQTPALIAEILANIPEHPTRYHIQKVLLNELGDTEEIAHLLASLRALWETRDLLVRKFGQEDACKIMNAEMGEY